MSARNLPAAAARKWIYGALSLKPYGNNLLSPSAYFWIGFARLIIALMATIEGLSWGYVGSLLGHDATTSALYSIGLGVFIFSIVWSIDASLMTLDVSAYRERVGDLESFNAGSSQAKGPPQTNTSSDIAYERQAGVGVWDSVWAFCKWPLFPVGIRSLIVVISVLVTAPFVSMYILKADIDKELERAFQSSLDAVKKGLEQKRSHELALKREELNKAKSDTKEKLNAWENARNDYVQEVSGKVGTGIIGEGAAAKAARKVSDEAKADYERAESGVRAMENDRSLTAAESDLQALEKAATSNDYKTLKGKFGIQEIPDSFKSRNKILTGFENDPEFKRIEYSVYSLLTFVVTALFLQKYFEPKSVRIYFSEERQSQWHEYSRGRYDPFLEAPNRSTNMHDGGISTISFCRMWDEIIAPALSNRGYVEAMVKVDAVRTVNAQKLEILDKLRARKSDLTDKIAAQLKVVKESGERHTAALNQTIYLRKALGELQRGANHIMFETHTAPSQATGENINKRLEESKVDIVKSEESAAVHRTSLYQAEGQHERLQQEAAGVDQQITALELDLKPVLELFDLTDKTRIEIARASLSRVQP